MNEKFKRISAFLILSLAVISIYSNAFHTSWHLDDKPNIINNYFLHLDSISFEKLKNTFYTDVHNPFQLGEKLYRPVPCLTFALNWYLGQDSTFGYHVVDIAIHIFTAFFLFLFILNIFNTPNLKEKTYNYTVLISILASLLWAANPIQTQAVTYIVQRMAQLAALFYIMAMYTYIKGRLSNSLSLQWVFFAKTVLFYTLAVYSKQNAVMFPFSIILVEMIFFQNLIDKKVQYRLGMVAGLFAVLIVLFGSIFFFKGDLLGFLDSYSLRTFTLEERILTEPKVIIFYLSQIFYPDPGRLSIAHDIVLSSSFIKPWTTILCILCIILMIAFALVRLKKSPLLSFAILFFFLNHIVESSIIPLEIIFEHRNYLPSFFLFLPISSLFVELFSSYRKNRFIPSAIIFLSLSLIIFFSISTYIRNKAWKNEIMLWTDAVAKAPNNARALNILAIKLAWGEESRHPQRYDMALKLFESSLDKHIPYKFHKVDILNNMALIYFYQKQNNQKAIQLFEEALNIHPETQKTRRNYAEALIMMEKFDRANQLVDVLITQNKNNGIYYNIKGHIFMLKKEYKAAYSLFDKAYRLMAPDKTINKSPVLLNAAVALSRSKEHRKAEQMLLNLIAEYPEKITYFLALIENSVRAEDGLDTIEKYVKEMFKLFDEKMIKYALENYTDNLRQAPISKELIMPFVEPQFKKNVQ